ncbi:MULTISPECIES: hypothetical protein [unclassified Methylibium]|uniref:hypothetical protein n=1 Tax=unclassified Methylibium TaxID=2633235 RepID=UPI0003F4472E|nr:MULTISPECIES: hypothetical protein [unclassified Methylibium]EWS56574.1 hypothetical protein X551_00568 [Methylibium sp. T29]EWS61526.1 hypothetical protein Y694_00696 [Methylibium sp. T29-B]
MKPTTFPTAVATAAVPTPAQELLVQAPLDTGAIALRPEQMPQAEQALATLDFAAIPSGDIIKIGLGAEQALQKTLDGFLARLDTKTASKVFALFGRLEKVSMTPSCLKSWRRFRKARTRGSSPACSPSSPAASPKRPSASSCRRSAI